MSKIDLTIHKEGLQHNIDKARENNIIIPTFAQMQNPETIPEKIQEKLKGVGLWDVNPLNLFRITWKNEPKESGGLYQKVPNYVEIPSKLSGVPCRIIAMAGKWFPTGCHKVGASFSRDLATEYQYRQEGVNDYLTSPVNIPELIRRIRYFIAPQEQIQAAE